MNEINYDEQINHVPIHVLSLFSFQMEVSDSLITYQGKYITVRVPSFDACYDHGLDFSLPNDNPSYLLPKIQILQTRKIQNNEETQEKNISQSMKKKAASNYDLAEIIIQTLKRVERKSLTEGRGEGFPLYLPKQFEDSKPEI